MLLTSLDARKDYNSLFLFFSLFLSFLQELCTYVVDGIVKPEEFASFEHSEEHDEHEEDKEALRPTKLSLYSSGNEVCTRVNADVNANANANASANANADADADVKVNVDANANTNTNTNE